MWIYFVSLPLGIITYFILFMAGFILKPPINQLPYVIVISVLDGLIIWFILKGFGVVPKIAVVIPSVIVGFIISFIYLEVAHDYATWDICYPEIRKQPIEVQNELGKDKTTRNYYQHLECEENILPFPWGKEAKFSNNPPGFMPEEASSEANPQ